MIEINALVMSRSLNNGYIFFEDKRKAKDWIRVLKQYKVNYVNFVIIFDKTKILWNKNVPNEAPISLFMW